MRRALVLAGLVALGCGRVVVDELEVTSTGMSPGSDGVSETGGGETSTSTSTSASTTDDTTSVPTSGSADDGPTGFIKTPDGGDSTVACDVFAQDCPRGEKCAPWAEGGGSAWNATKCVPVTGDQKPGQPCTAEGGGVSGLDDCIEGVMCWDVDHTNEGECVELCSGSEDTPLCTTPLTGCAISSGVLNVCVPVCEPLVQDCPGEDLCLPISGTYMCVLDASGDGGAAFDPCAFANACDKGLLCLGPAAASECDRAEQGCCLPMCSLADAGADCPGVGQTCLPMFDPQPQHFEDIGYCTLM